MSVAEKTSQSHGYKPAHFLDEKYYREAKDFKVDPRVGPTIDLVIFPIPTHYDLHDLVQILEEADELAGTARMMYMVKDRRGHMASIANDPYEGGNTGLEGFPQFKIDNLEPIRDTPDIQDLGTALVTMERRVHAEEIIGRFDKRELVKVEDGKGESKWIIKNASGEPHIPNGDLITMRVQKYEDILTDTGKCLIQFPQPKKDEVYVAGEISIYRSLKHKVMQ